MTSTTTQHLEALLVDDGREFAMIRKGDLRALLQIANSDPHMGRYLEPLGELHRKADQREQVITESMQCIEKMSRIARKHGDERRRYMGNNRALLSRVDQLEYAITGIRDHWQLQREQMAGYIDLIIEGCDREAAMEAKLRRIGRFKLKYPSVAVLMDVTP